MIVVSQAPIQPNVIMHTPPPSNNILTTTQDDNNDSIYTSPNMKLPKPSAILITIQEDNLTQYFPTCTNGRIRNKPKYLKDYKIN